MLENFWRTILSNLHKLCLNLNREIKNNKLAIYTWGNVSVRKSEDEILIKPSGIAFDKIKLNDLSQISIKNGNLISGKKPSVDTLIHLEIYKAFPKTKSIIHTHSLYATSFAQAKKYIPLLGTTHADYFKSDIPLADQIKLNNKDQMETLVGKSIVRSAKKNLLQNDPVKAVLIPSHGPVIWSDKAENIIESAVVLERIAKLAYFTMNINPKIVINKKDKSIFDFHYSRKHGKRKYYGQSIRQTRNS